MVSTSHTPYDPRKAMAETIPELFSRQATLLARKPLFFVKRQDSYQPITWQQAAEDVQAFSLFLLDQQVAPGDRVAILSENRPEWGIADLAIQSIGAWTVPIYPSLCSPDIETICRDCQPVLGIASTVDQVNKLLEVRQRIASLRCVVALDAGQQQHPQHLEWSQALTQGRGEAPALHEQLEQRKGRIRPTDIVTVIYTSGTTGEPKGVMLSHQNFLSNVEACLNVIPVSNTDLHLSFLPLCHIFERMAGWYLMLSAGAAVAYAENMESIPTNMLEVHPTVMLGVPRFFEKLYVRIQEGLRQAPPLKRQIAEWAIRVGQASAAADPPRPLPLSLSLQRIIADRLVYHTLKEKLGGRLRFFVSGGAALSQEIGEFFYSIGVTILEGYGLTETSPVITVNQLPRPRFGSVGRVVDGVEIQIADDGEILTRGPHIMQGYYQKPDATAAVMTGGWFHTGDIGHLDRDGYLFITDRKKDLIKTAGGKFVAPQKLEGLFITDPYISQAFVYGEKQPYCVALIVPNVDQLRRYAQEQEIAARSLQDLARDSRVLEFYWKRIQAKQAELASFEQVKKIALLDQEFSQAAGELTPTLKAKRTVIAQKYESLLRNLYQASG